MKPKVYKRSIAKWKDEQTALADVLQVQNLQPEQLKANHTEKEFVFVLQVATAPAKPKAKPKAKPNQYAKTAYSEKEATEAAMQDLETFEGNLQPDHTKTHYVFKKVR
jgi:hypothetical protein